MAGVDLRSLFQHLQCGNHIIALVIKAFGELRIIGLGAVVGADIFAPGAPGRIAVAPPVRQEGGQPPAHQHGGRPRPTDIRCPLVNGTAVIGDHAGKRAFARRQVEIPVEGQIATAKADLFGDHRQAFKRRLAQLAGLLLGTLEQAALKIVDMLAHGVANATEFPAAVAGLQIGSLLLV